MAKGKPVPRPEPRFGPGQNYSLLGEKTRFRHQVAVRLFRALQPGYELVAGHRGLVVGALFHVVLPVLGRGDLLEQIDVEGDLLLANPRGAEDAALLLDLAVDTGLLA